MTTEPRQPSEATLLFEEVQAGVIAVHIAGYERQDWSLS